MANDNIQANSEKKVVIELDNVRRDFLVGEETVHALKGVSFKIYEGEGTVFGSINQKDFKNLIQLKVPEVLVSKFEINAGALDYKIELNSLNIIELTKLRDTLLPKLMSGELRIPDVAALVDDVL